MFSYDAELEKQLKATYPVGTRLMCTNMPDDPYPIPAGTEGTVKGTNGFGQIQMRWDNGSGLSLLVGIDEFRVIEEESV